MDWSSPDQATALAMFKQRCNLYFSVKDIKKEKQVDHILLFAGEQGIRIFNSWSLSDTDKANPDKIWTNFETQIDIGPVCLMHFRN